ncbi:MAG: helix-turn-helix transcriptional regulator [Desulfatirhabdiaceae bacterium]
MEHRNTSPLDTTLTFTGPVEMKRRAIELMQSIGFTDTDETIPWEQAFPEYRNNFGAVLRGARGKEGITQKQLSNKTGIPQRHISEMENGKRPIGKKNAKLFAIALNIDYRVFL